VSNSNGHPARGVGIAIKQLHNLPPLARKKSPVLAFVLAFFFGCIGYGLYTRDWWGAAFLALAMLGITFVLPGLGWLLVLLFGACLAAYRINKSNSDGGHV
jgi:hypothetical protein